MNKPDQEIEKDVTESSSAELVFNGCFIFIVWSLCGLIVFQLYNVNSSGDPEESIYGIMFEKFPATPKSDRKYFVMVSTLRYRNWQYLHASDVQYPIKQGCHKPLECQHHFNLVPRAFSSFKMAVGETPGQGCQSGSKSSLEFCHANTMKCLCFVWITVSDCRKQTGPPDAGNNLRKSHFIMCHVTRDSWSISAALARGFSDRHFERGEGPGDEVGRQPSLSQAFV